MAEATPPWIPSRARSSRVPAPSASGNRPEDACASRKRWRPESPMTPRDGPGPSVRDRDDRAGLFEFDAIKAYRVHGDMEGDRAAHLGGDAEVEHVLVPLPRSIHGHTRRE